MKMRGGEQGLIRPASPRPLVCMQRGSFEGQEIDVLRRAGVLLAGPCAPALPLRSYFLSCKGRVETSRLAANSTYRWISSGPIVSHSIFFNELLANI